MRVASILGIAFVIAAITFYGLVYALGALVGTADMPDWSRFGFGGGTLLALAAVDLVAIRKSSYCPLGLRRQTPRVLMRRYRMEVVSAYWGFDLGLVVTTFRVAAISWGALLFVSLGFTPWWAGLGYGLGFALPLMLLLRTHRAGRSAREPVPSDPGLESMLGNRTAMQRMSAILLVVSGWILIARIGA